jgi:hypothetical protein
MDDELKDVSTAEKSQTMESAVQESLEKRKKQFEVPSPKQVVEKMDAFTTVIREKASKFAADKLVRRTPLTPIIRYGLDLQKGGAALMYGKDVDTGKKLTYKQSAEIAVSKLGSALWQQTIAGGEVAGLALGANLLKKIGMKLGERAVNKRMYGRGWIR